MTATKGSERVSEGKTDYTRVKDHGWVERINKAMDANPQIPPPHYGRLSWFVREFQTRYGATLTSETVRKWTMGIALPRQPRRGQLAEILGVDEAWLVVGGPTVDARERKQRNAEAEGTVNLLAGLIQMDGGNPAFPDDGSRNSRRAGVDLYAVIRGAHYAICVARVAQTSDTTWKVSVPAVREDLVVLTIIRGDGFSFDVLEIDEDSIIQHGQPENAQRVLTLTKSADGYLAGGSRLRQVKTFAERL